MISYPVLLVPTKHAKILWAKNNETPLSVLELVFNDNDNLFLFHIPENKQVNCRTNSIRNLELIVLTFELQARKVMPTQIGRTINSRFLNRQVGNQGNITSLQWTINLSKLELLQEAFQ